MSYQGYLLFAMETAGAAIILRVGVPIYRQILLDVSSHVPRVQTIGWATLAIVLIQSGYWGRLLFPSASPRGKHIVLAHAVLFLARLSFIFGASIFSMTFFLRFDELHLTPLRLGILMAVLFSLFCYTQELERLGRRFYPGELKDEPADTCNRPLTNSQLKAFYED
ncbi:MAG TPA: hypothetical protein VKY92_04670 [Verrucomicrobiae bacterium]|nr:hypothetical protein [Verrucomicrobiae bacterium]